MLVPNSVAKIPQSAIAGNNNFHLQVPGKFFGGSVEVLYGKAHVFLLQIFKSITTKFVSVPGGTLPVIYSST